MKKWAWLLLACGISQSVLAAPPVTVSRHEMGKDVWAFSREEVMLSCGKEGALFAINPGTLAQYPLNEIGTQQMNNKQVNASPITVIVDKRRSQHDVQRFMDLLIARAQTLCE